MLSFLKIAAKDPKVAAFAPTSPKTVRHIFSRLPKRFGSALEYGPGDGVLTRPLLERLAPDGRLLALETNERFAALLNENADPRLSVVHGSASDAPAHAEALGIGPFDLAISGIPFTMLSVAERERIVRQTHGLLRPGGIFLVYQFSPLMVRYMKERFDVSTTASFGNFPPYFVMEAVKRV